jgi:hypothetical protein
MERNADIGLFTAPSSLRDGILSLWSRNGEIIRGVILTDGEGATTTGRIPSLYTLHLTLYTLLSYIAPEA